MSKSSSTNYPKGFFQTLSHLRYMSKLSGVGTVSTKPSKMKVLLGGYSSEDPPLPIPNREVKLTHADGTA